MTSTNDRAYDHLIKQTFAGSKKMTTSQVFKKQDFRFTAKEMTNGLYLTLVLDKVRQLMGNVDISILEEHHFKIFNKGIVHFVEYATSGVWCFGIKKGTQFDDLLPVDGLSDESIESFWSWINANDNGALNCQLEALNEYYDMLDDLEKDYWDYRKHCEIDFDTDF